jgi:heat-inducible transcriptional repressor
MSEHQTNKPVNKTDTSQLSERAAHLFRALVERYIRDGQPVGSRTLSRELAWDLSPATIRNVMADLEDMGLIFSPHTSSGRVPTPLGYRFFIDTLLQVKPLQQQEEALLRQRFKTHLPGLSNAKTVLAQTSDLLSEMTRFAGVVMLPRRRAKVLRHIEFLVLSKNRVLAILVLNDGEVQNRFIETLRDYTPSELEQVSHYLNAAFGGRSVDQVRHALLQELQEARRDFDELLQWAMTTTSQALDDVEAEQSDLVLTGQINLMDVDELCRVDKLRELFVAFNEKQEILGLLDQALTGEGVQIFIGGESGYSVFDDCSVVAAPYGLAGEVIGVLGVIGPTRMNYDRVIPIVDLTAQLLGSALHQGS